uniref:Reverse transcriptase domain-containing protein n=1 Tax=Fagus sylvatica TaxID=28930 RepID=A0A2N9IGG3_FAGSY
MGHATHECPTIPAFKEVLHDQANAMNTYKKPFQSPYAETYNPGWRNHPNFSWRNENNAPPSQGPSNFVTYNPPHKRTLEDTLQTFMQGQSTINSQTSQAINDIRSTLTKLTTSLSTQEKGKFSAQPQPNPQGQFGVIGSSDLGTQHEHVKSITTLRSGKVIDKTIPTKAQKPEELSKPKSDDKLDKSESSEAVKCPILAPFPQRLQPPQKLSQNSEIFEILKQVKINIPLIEKALLDLGASVNLLPYSVYEQLGLESCLVNSLDFDDDEDSEVAHICSVLNSSQVLEVNAWRPKIEELPPRNIMPVPSSVEAPKLELKPLPVELKYAFLGQGGNFSSGAITWTIADIKGISPLICTHRIYLEDNVKPSREMQRRLNPNMKEVVRAEVLKLLDVGIIYLISDSKWVSPTQVVPKKSGVIVVKNQNNELIPTRVTTGWRVCIDYRKLNSVTRKDHFPLPFMDQILERVAGHEYYCFLDGYSGYNQIKIALEDQEKTNFSCPFGTFAYRRMPFGLCNAPATFQRSTFQRCMISLFSDMVERFLEVFMDDFSVFGDSFDDCSQPRSKDKVLIRCEEKNLVLNWEKCHFMVSKGIVLGHIVSSQGIEVDKSKIELISKLPTPKTVKDIRSFLGHAGFYRRFIKDFSVISRPLCNLLSKDTPFEWTEACQEAFEKLKGTLTSAPIMQPPDWSLPFEIMCDASDYAVGAVLGQRQIPSHWTAQDKKKFFVEGNYPLVAWVAISSGNTTPRGLTCCRSTGNKTPRGLSAAMFFRAYDPLVALDCQSTGHHTQNCFRCS